MKKGLFVVLHGINNLGKTTQAKLLVEKLQSEGHKAEYMKYPVYDLDPSGKIPDQILWQALADMGLDTLVDQLPKKLNT